LYMEQFISFFTRSNKNMIDIWKNDKDFKEAIGSFVIAFSELEFGLVFLCSMTEFDIRVASDYTLFSKS